MDWARETPRVYVARDSAYKGEVTQAQMDRLADAGFTVFGHRWVLITRKKLDRERIETHVRISEEAGLDYVPWMRGSLRGEPKDPDKRVVWANGEVQPVYGPMAPELWAHLENALTYLAELSRDRPVAGAFLDFENYYPNKQANFYHRSYNRHAIRLFAEATEAPAPPEDLKPGEGPDWLRERDLKEAFDAWQRRAFRQRLADLRASLDAVNPRFLIGFYAGSGMLDSNLDAIATPEAPAVLLPPSSYGRPSPLLDQKTALLANRNYGREMMAVAREQDTPFRLLAGILPGHKGSDPEFTGKNISGMAAVTDGVWIWDEGKGDTAEQFRWMTIANLEIARGESRLHHEPRLEPEQLDADPPEATTDRLQIGLLGERAGNLTPLLEETGKYEAHSVEALNSGHLAAFDLVLLQNFTASLPEDSDLHKTLREYVANGGALILSHRTGRFLESPFPDIAERARPDERVLAGFQVADSAMRIRKNAAEEIGGPRALPDEAAFTAGFPDHVIFAPGPEGKVLVRDRFGDATYVVGDYGEGRAAFVGSFIGYSEPPEGAERTLFLNMIDWLTR